MDENKEAKNQLGNAGVAQSFDDVKGRGGNLTIFNQEIQDEFKRM